MFLETKYCLAKCDEKIVCSANCKKIKSLLTKLAEKWGCMGVRNLLVFLPEGKKGLFLVRSQKKNCMGGET